MKLWFTAMKNRAGHLIFNFLCNFLLAKSQWYLHMNILWDFKSNVNLRPFLYESIKKLKEHCEVIIFTSSHHTYANIILDHIDPDKKLFDLRLYRSSCVLSKENLYLKDLRIFSKHRKMKDLILVDNAAYSFGL
jgi:TFIIF-interacting CTD phosphatase-like protein